MVSSRKESDEDFALANAQVNSIISHKFVIDLFIAKRVYYEYVLNFFHCLKCVIG